MPAEPPTGAGAAPAGADGAAASDDVVVRPPPEAGSDEAPPRTELGARLRDRFAPDTLRLHESEAGGVVCETGAGRLLAVCERLRDDPGLRFEQLLDVCAVDYAAYGHADWETSETATSSGFSRGAGYGRYPDRTWEGRRFAVVYHLLSVSRNRRLRLKVFLDGEYPRVPSVLPVWASADWFEREAFDLFGILFEGHPDLRRLLTDYGFVGHPFRKDFPLSGHVEMRYDPEKGRVVYEPVTIEERILVPRVIRRDQRYAPGGAPGRGPWREEAPPDSKGA